MKDALIGAIAGTVIILAMFKLYEVLLGFAVLCLVAYGLCCWEGAVPDVSSAETDDLKQS